MSPPLSSVPVALEPFLLLAKSASGAAAVQLIRNATAAPGVYVFGELLACEHIRMLRQSQEHGWAVTLLELFAYGTCQDLDAVKVNLPPLNQPQLGKLRQLSLLQLALRAQARAQQTLAYAELQQALNISSVRELEDVIIDAIYQNLLIGCLDQRRGVLVVDRVLVGRDVAPSDWNQLETTLSHWCTRTDALLVMLTEQIHYATQQFEQQQVESERFQQELQEALDTSAKLSEDASATSPPASNSSGRKKHVSQSKHSRSQETVDSQAAMPTMMDLDHTQVFRTGTARQGNGTAGARPGTTASTTAATAM